ncbi:MAG TPA: pirin family protein [Vicinamibacteria bacterium]|nr:pirin family protein [Vicinamibacteria bacterium]
MSNLAPAESAELCAGEPASPTFEALTGRLTDLAGLSIRRLLPRSRRRMVGPWCFLDAYGPLSFRSGKPIDVAPHPHVGIQTVSWLLEGEVLHNDSLGLSGSAVPGTLNLMTAGRGIAHSEETPASNTGRLKGVQLWVALPAASRETEPGFEQHRALPVVELDGGRATVFLGALAGARSPARCYSPVVGADVAGEPERRLALPLDRGFEHALVVLGGGGRLGDERLAPDTLYYLGCGRSQLLLQAERDGLRLLVLGGAPFGETILMWWNFVARTTEEIVAAREDWQAGRRFGEVRAYAGPRLDAPPFVARPVPRP